MGGDTVTRLGVAVVVLLALLALTLVGAIVTGSMWLGCILALVEVGATVLVVVARQ